MSSVEDRIRVWMDSYGDPLTLYREVYLTSPDALNPKALGRFWTPELKVAHSPYGKLDNKPGTQPYILKVQAPRSGVDESETISTMKRHPGELEIRLKKGTAVRFLGMTDASGKMVHMRKPAVSIASLASKLTLRGDADLALLLLLEARSPKLPRKMTLYHAGPPGIRKFDVRFIGRGEGMQALGPGIYFLDNARVALVYGKYVSNPHLYTVEVDTRGLYSNSYGHPPVLRDRLIKVADEMAAERGLKRLPPGSALNHGSGTVGDIVRAVGNKKALKIFKDIGLQGSYTFLPGNLTEVAIYDPSIIRITDVKDFEDIDEEGLSFPEEKDARATEVFQIPTEDELREMFRRQKQHGRYMTPEEVEKAVRYRMRWLTNPKVQHKAKKAIEEAKRNYHNEAALGKSYKSLLARVRTNPSRDLTPFHDVYKEAMTQAEIDAIATGQLIPYGWMGPFKPIEIVVSDELPDPYIEDGNHRLQAAREHGATRVRAKVRYVEDGLTVQDVTVIIPLR